MAEEKGMLQKTLDWLKTAIFEKGKLIYRTNIPSFRRSRKTIEARQKKQRVRVGFMIQCPQNWAVLQSVYEAALNDKRVEPVVLLIPEMEFAYYVKLKNVIWEKTYAFGDQLFGDCAVRTYNPQTQEWLDLQTLQLDYVFVPRPYETYLPKDYRASSIRRYAKVCYVPYAFPILSDWEVLYNSHFIRNVAMIFCEKEKSAEYVRNHFSPTVRCGDQKVFLCGYPKFDLIEDHSGNESPLWPRKRDVDITRIIWTPRWTTDPKLGGSNFFRYKDQIISWAEKDRQIDLVFRPHPLALEHYVSAGLMTDQEQKDYLERYAKCENACVDRTTTYYDTFYSSDCLITDVSSIIMDYLFTDKPIIYCKSTDDEHISLPDLRECMYMVDSFEEMKETVKKIRKGEDPQKEARQRLIRKLKPMETSAVLILNEIKKDYFGIN